jgi:hypothetical protein
MIGIGRQRVGAPVEDAVHDDADPDVLARLVPLPVVARPDHDRHGIPRFALDPLDPSPKLLRRPQRVDQLQVVIRQERREQRPHRVQRLAPDR